MATTKKQSFSLIELNEALDDQLGMLINGDKDFDEQLMKRLVSVANAKIRSFGTLLKAMNMSTKRYDSASIPGLLDGIQPIT